MASYVTYLNLIWCWQVIVHVCHDNITDNRLMENVMATRAIKGLGSIGMHSIRKGKLDHVAMTCTLSH